MKRIIRRGNDEDTVIVEATGNVPEEEKIKIFRSIPLKTENVGLILITCTKCKEEIWMGRELLINVSCQKCGSRDFLSGSKFKLFCEKCGEKSVENEEIFNSTHCAGGVWKTN